MSRLCWIFVLAVVVVPLSDGRPQKCEQRERSLADLDLAEDALKRAKLLVPNCEDENDVSNSSECSRKNKSFGFIDVALNLVADAKKSIPICPKEPPTNVTTEEPRTNVTTWEPKINVTTWEPKTNVTTWEPFTNVTTEEPTTNITTQKPMDCQDLQAAGVVSSGVYTVWPRGGKSAVRVRCDMDTDGGGWTVIQRRGNFSQQENFDRDWQDYKNGFGNLERDFWIGNDNIFALTSQDNYALRMDMSAVNGDRAYALFRVFMIEDETANYTLHVSGHSGTAGDSITYSRTEMFSTRDRKNDGRTSGNCAEMRKGGFWYDNCAWCNPNGLYRPGVEDQASMNYFEFKKRVGLFSIDMKIKRLS